MKKQQLLTLVILLTALATSCTKEVDTTTVVLKADFADSLLMAADVRIDYVILDNVSKNLQSEDVTTTSWRKSGPGTEGAFRVVFTPKDTLLFATYDLSFTTGIVFQVKYKDGSDASFKGDQIVADAGSMPKSQVVKCLNAYTDQVKLATYIYRTNSGNWVVQHDSSFDELWSD